MLFRSILHGLLWNSVHLLRFEPGVIEMRAPGCPRDFPARLMDMLGRWTGRRWIVSLSDQPQGEPTLAEQAASAVAAAYLLANVVSSDAAFAMDAAFGAPSSTADFTQSSSVIIAARSGGRTS